MIYGFIIFCIGVLTLVNIFIPGLGMTFDVLWPVGLMIIALFNMVKNRVFNAGHIIAFYLGLFFFIQNSGLFGDIMPLLLPTMLMLFGLSYMVAEHKNDIIMPVIDGKNIMHFTSVLADAKTKVESKNFRGAKIISVLGGIDLDMREINLKDDCQMTIISIFSSSNIEMPKDANVVLNSMSMLGGNENKCPEKKDAKTIQVNCYSFFGGVELK